MCPTCCVPHLSLWGAGTDNTEDWDWQPGKMGRLGPLLSTRACEWSEAVRFFSPRSPALLWKQQSSDKSFSEVWQQAFLWCLWEFISARIIWLFLDNCFAYNFLVNGYKWQNLCHNFLTSNLKDQRYWVYNDIMHSTNPLSVKERPKFFNSVNLINKKKSSRIKLLCNHSSKWKAKVCQLSSWESGVHALKASQCKVLLKIRVVF